MYRVSTALHVDVPVYQIIFHILILYMVHAQCQHVHRALMTFFILCNLFRFKTTE